MQLLEKIIDNDISIIAEIKGYFCGIFYDLEQNLLYLFTDSYGHYDLFYYYENSEFIISDEFNEILQYKTFSLKNIDIESLYEFVIFEVPLFDKTFIKTIKFLPMGTIFEINLNNHQLKSDQYQDYIFKIDPKITSKIGIKKLELLFDNAMLRIKKLNPSDTIYGLGLSGGMDSRLVAYYALKNDLKLRSFIFGERHSDAYYIAKKIARLLKLDHYELGVKRYFFIFFEKSIKYNPMMNVLYMWYHAIFKDLPKFNILLTGYNGDNQFGSHLKISDFYIKNHKEFSNIIFEKYCEIGNMNELKEFFKYNSVILKIIKGIIDFSKNSPNSKFWQKKEEFNYKYRQRIYIKNNPSFNFLGSYESFSIFTDLDLLEFLMQIPFKLRLNRRLFFDFLKEKCPLLFKIRGERSFPRISRRNFLLFLLYETLYKVEKKLRIHFIFKKSHKTVWLWLSDYEPFSKYLNKTFNEENELFNEIFNHNKVMGLISKNKWNRSEIYLTFRLLTIKLFLDWVKLGSINEI